MKKVMTIAAALLVSLAAVIPANARIITFGPKVGLNVNHLSSSNKTLMDPKNQCGFTAGVMAEANVPLIGIAVDLSLMYTHMTSDANQGNVKVGNSTLTAHETKIFQNMLEIPLNLKYKVNIPAVSRIIRPYVFTGPTLALRLGGNHDENTDNEIDYDWKTAQWGWNVGLGVELINHLQIGAGYTFGLNDVVKKSLSLGGIDVNKKEFKIKNNYWTVTAAWLF